MHICDEIVTKFLKNFSFIQYILNTLFHNYGSFRHLFHSKGFPCFHLLDSPNFSISTFSNYLNEGKVSNINNFFIFLCCVFGCFSHWNVKTSFFLRIITFDDICQRFLNLLFCFINYDWFCYWFDEIVGHCHWLKIRFLFFVFWLGAHNHFLWLTFFKFSYFSQWGFRTDFGCHLWIFRCLCTTTKPWIGGFG